jgi:hypothetical protein
MEWTHAADPAAMAVRLGNAAMVAVRSTRRRGGRRPPLRFSTGLKLVKQSTIGAGGD